MSSDVFHIEEPSVRSSFDRASTTYEATAVLQARVSAELLERLEAFEFRPGVLLDLGAGTGRDTEELKRRYRRSLVIALDVASGMLAQAQRHQHFLRRFECVCGNASSLPFATHSVDVVFSNLMLQWCNSLDDVFAEIRRVLKPEGFFAFSTFGPDTLQELRAAWAAADSYNHVNRFTDMHDVGAALLRAGLTEPVLDVDRIQLVYPDTRALMKELKRIGAHNVTAGRSRGLMGRSRLGRMQAAYEAFRTPQGLPATYEVVYGAAWGDRGKEQAPMHGGETAIALSAIRRKPR